MAGDKVLVLGATGPAGIVLLRELLHRKHATIAYVRTPSKIPQDLEDDPLLEVVQGTMEDTASLSAVIATAYIIVSFLGPNDMRSPMPYPGYYSLMFPLMREHGVKRILAMCTPSVAESNDNFNLLVNIFIRRIFKLLAPGAYQCMQNVARVFRDEAQGLDWTLFRITAIPGESDADSWKRDREHSTYVGYVGDKDWKYWTNRSGLARWLVDTVEQGQGKWVGKLPAVSDRTTSRK
ncbi:NAD(P)-binding protein [Eremomyces bilateralis CBS 781.70]|uniref:NAD(P)-binding protein n=1 Tax=Eremomyces bilateralis CBS 781.70 TaxID=1392243 RepID=A0A6G1GC87_9PEZI|nr:NAD(P)-binding protein [Eremomyces bilateralis CBS 781.70]KAF1815602.1 NAD(P)-binding protein [Eremomyces bilateralis CBS 781.70]